MCVKDVDRYSWTEPSHARHFLEKHKPTHNSEPYSLSCPLPKQIFVKNYPLSPGNFGEKLRKARMDAGLMIKELAAILGVSEDTVINWEVRGVSPTSRNLERLDMVLLGLGHTKLATSRQKT